MHYMELQTILDGSQTTQKVFVPLDLKYFRQSVSIVESEHVFASWEERLKRVSHEGLTKNKNLFILNS